MQQTLRYVIEAIFVFFFAFSSEFAAAIIFSILAGITRSLAEPVHDGLLNRLIGDSKAKAMLFSFNGQVDSVGQILGGPPAGFLANKFRIAYGLCFSALCLFPVIGAALFVEKNVKNQKRINFL